MCSGGVIICYGVEINTRDLGVLGVKVCMESAGRRQSGELTCPLERRPRAGRFAVRGTDLEMILRWSPRWSTMNLRSMVHCPDGEADGHHTESVDFAPALCCLHNYYQIVRNYPTRFPLPSTITVPSDTRPSGLQPLSNVICTLDEFNLDSKPSPCFLSPKNAQKSCFK